MDRRLINQLFKRCPTYEELDDIARCFGLKNIDDTREFHKFSMEQVDTPAQMERLRPMLDTLYIPCKMHMYMPCPLKPRSCITVLRQLVRLHGYSVNHREAQYSGTKFAVYWVCKQGVSTIHFSKNPAAVNMS
jgi:hypothetical protein